MRTKADWEQIIRDLKLKSKSTTPEEKEAIEERIAYLMSKYQVELIESKQDTSRIHGEGYDLEFDGAFTPIQASLFTTIAKHFNCDVIQLGVNKYVVFGFDSDLDIVEFMFARVSNQMFAELANVRIPDGVHAKTYRTSWLKGYRSKIWERLQEAKKQSVKESTPGYGIELASRNRQVQLAVRKRFPRLVTKKSYYRSREAFASGQEAGSRADFQTGSNLGTGGRKELT